MKITKIVRKAKSGERLADFEKEPRYKTERGHEISEEHARKDLEYATNNYNYWKDKVENETVDSMMPVYDEVMAIRMMNDAEILMNEKQEVVDSIIQMK